MNGYMYEQGKTNIEGLFTMLEGWNESVSVGYSVAL